MKDVIKVVWYHFLLIVVCLLGFQGILGLINQSTFSYLFPMQILGVSALTALCSLVYYGKYDMSRKEFIVRIIIHFILISIVVLGFGYLASWYDSIEGALGVFFVFIIVYVFVWIMSFISDKKTSDNINEALRKKNND